MKFVRYGSLAPQSAKRWSIDKAPMPAPRGIYTFPYGYMDEWYIWKGHGCDANPRVQYLKDETGRRLFYDELLDTSFQSIEDKAERIDFEFPNLSEHQKSRLLRLGKFTPRWVMYLGKKYHLKEEEDVWPERRKSWIMVMDDPSNPPRLTHDPNDRKLTPEQVEAIPLNQKLHFLKGENGKRIYTEDFLCEGWNMERFWNDIHPLTWDEVQEYKFIDNQSQRVVDSPFRQEKARINYLMHDHNTHKAKTFARKFLQKWLASKGIRLEQLCPWPVYPNDRALWAVMFSNPHVFEYSGCLWHLLEEYIKPSEIIRRVDG